MTTQLATPSTSTPLTLRTYQQRDAAKLLRTLSRRRGALNLSKPRTGKLIEFIWVVGQLQDVLGTVLYVAPLATLLNVRDEFMKWQGMTVLVNPTRAEFENLRQTALQPAIVAINKEKLRDTDHWVFDDDAQWDLFALDEAHHFRGRNSQQTKGAIHIAVQHANKVLAMTGSPLMRGQPSELWPLLHIVEPKRWPHFWPYMKRHAIDMYNYKGTSQDEKSPFKRGAQAAILKWLKRRSVRRPYDYKGQPMIYRPLPFKLAEADESHYAAYKELEKEWRVEIDGFELVTPSILELSNRLKQLAASPRLVGAEPLGGKVELLRDYADGYTGKLVVWTWHRQMADVLHEVTADLPGFEYRTVIHGKSARSIKKRHRLVGEAQEAKTALVFATIASLSEGQNLDTFHEGLYFERSWLPGNHEQADSRILGENQKGAPITSWLYSEDTMEAKLERVLRKRDTINSKMVAVRELIKEAQDDN